MHVGGIQVNKTAPVWSQVGDIEYFESSDGHTYLLVAGRSDGILVVNATNPHVPVQIGSISYKSSEESWRMDVEVFKSPEGRNYALLAGSDAMILDVTDPQSPVPVNDARGDPGVLDDAYDTTIFEPSDGHTYAWVEGSSEVRIVDMTDPHDPVLVNDGRDNFFVHHNGAVFESPDGHAYAMSASPIFGLYIEDVTDPHNPVPVAVVRHDGYPAERFLLSVDAISELPVILIPGEYAAGLFHAETMATFESSDRHVYAMIANNGVTSTFNGEDARIIPTGILFMDVTDPRAPVPIYDIRNGDDGFDIGSHIRSIKVFESPDGHAYAAIAGGWDVLVMDITDPRAPVLAGKIQDGEGGFYEMGIVSSMALFEQSDGIVYLATVSDEGVQIMDITSPHQPVPVGTLWDDQSGISAIGTASYHAVFGPGDGHTYALGTGTDGVHVVDVTVPHAPVPVSSMWDGKDGFDTLDRAGHIASLRSADGRSYALVGSAEGVQIADVTDPHNPSPAGSIRDGKDGFESEWITGIAILQPTDDRAYAMIADHRIGIHIVDITDPSAPVLAGGMLAEDGFDILGGVHAIAVYRQPQQQPDGRDYALVTGDWGIHIVDIANPSEPALTGTLRGGVGNYTFTAAD